MAGLVADYGTEGDDLVLNGTIDADNLYRLGGNDVLLGGDGDDLIDGGSGNDHLDGGAGANRLLGGDGDDFFMMQHEGDTTAQGGAGNDAFYLGAGYGWYDFIDGGAGSNDQLGLQGMYTGAQYAQLSFANVEVLLRLSGNDTRFGDTSGSFYSYDVTTYDTNVAAGGQLVIDANALRPGENFSFNGGSESDGSFFIYAGQGTDVLIGGARDDVFLFRDPGGFTAADRLDGGGGTLDQLGLRGDYTGANALIFEAATMTRMEEIVLISGFDTRFGSASGVAHSYDVTLHDANLAAGQLATIDAGSLTGSERLSFNGAAETNGRFQLFGGQGDDTLIGGSGGDMLHGNVGADILTGGGGSDVLHYDSVNESNAAGRDTITGFARGFDKIDLSRIDASAVADGDNAFGFIGPAAFSGVAGQLRAYQNGTGWMVEGDVDGDGVADLLIMVETATPLTGTDFIL